MNEDAEEPQEFIKITHSRLSADEVSQLVTSPSCGAVSIFIGCVSHVTCALINSALQIGVISPHLPSSRSAEQWEGSKITAPSSTRNTFDGKKVVRLEYECYIPMAEMEIKKIFLDVRRQWPHVKHLAVHHRLGLVPVSEASVVIAVSSPHRSDSLDAVKYCINRLKATVPIWKKEVYEEESYSWKENKECFWKDQDEI
uniref:Molybdopterin synthase catalytic subunit n=1 Tax=Xenopus tropicalis TaxID=8364 RepID=A0A803JA07_XENTR